MLHKSILFFCAVSLSACATVEPTPSETALPSHAHSAAPAVEHVVRQGETLWRISRIYQTDLEDIIRFNQILDSANISPGQKILVPGKSSSAATTLMNLPAPENIDFIWPAKGKIVTRFREKRDGVASKGIDILTEAPQDVFAARSGKVIFVGDLIGYGKTIIIGHGDGLSTVYAGNASVAVNLGDEIKQGAVVAKTGQPPRKKQSCLYFEVRKRHRPQNPLHYLN